MKQGTTRDNSGTQRAAVLALTSGEGSEQQCS
jgi:hypothetical protein